MLVELAVVRVIAQSPDLSGAVPASDLFTQFAGYGMAGVLFFMVIFKWKIQPTYVLDDAKVEWERERTRLETENAELKEAAKESTAVYTKDVVPMMTLVVERMREWIDALENLPQKGGD